MELLEVLVKLLVIEQGISHLPPAWEHLNGIVKKEKFLKQITMAHVHEILDAIILMCNADTFLNYLADHKFEQILGILKMPAFGETQMKADVLAGQLAAAGQPMTEEPKIETLEEAHARIKEQKEAEKGENKVEEVVEEVKE